MFTIEGMTIDDYDDAARLWTATPEVGVSLIFDTRPRLAAYLQRNKGLSTVAYADGLLIGTLLCGHDGRRGSLYHMAVAQAYRQRGIARQMVARSLTGLRAEGIHTAFLFVANDNPAAAAFWLAMGWEVAPHVQYYFAAF